MQKRSAQPGFTLIELLVVVAIIGIISAIAVPLLQRAILRAEVGAAAAEARSVYTAFKRHHVDLDAYPNASSSPTFKVDTFEPLTTLGYYDGAIIDRLLGDKADAYDSPDDMGQNREFWLEMTLAYDPTIRLLVADSDNAPLTGGVYADGVYVYQNGVLREAHEVR